MFWRSASRTFWKRICFAVWILDRLDDDFGGEDFQARLGRPLDLNLLARLELLAGRGAHGLLDRLDYHVAVYALLLADGVDALPDGCAHMFYVRCRSLEVSSFGRPGGPPSSTVVEEGGAD